MSKLVGGLALSTWCLSPPQLTAVWCAAGCALCVWGSPVISGWWSEEVLQQKAWNLRLPLLKNIACFCWSGWFKMRWWTFLYGFWCRRYLETKIWGDLLGFALVTIVATVSQWTDQPCPLGRMPQRLPCLGKRWSRRGKGMGGVDIDMRPRNLGISWGFGGKKYVPNDDLDGWGNMLYYPPGN